MGVQNPNSTNYVHPNEPNLLNVHKAMTYDPTNGEPHLRVTLGSDNITVSGNVNLVESVRVNNTEAQRIPVYLVGNVLSVTQGTTPWVTTGNANVTVVGNVAGITTLPAITGNVGVSGNVSITQMPGIAVTSMPEVEIKNDAGNPVPISANTSVNSISNRIYVSGDTDLTIATSNYEFNIARGLIPGSSAVNVFGYQASVGTVPQTVWDVDTDYTFPNTAGKLTLVSTSASDNTSAKVTIYGLDANWAPLVEQVTLNGTTNVTTAGTFLRINQMIMTAPGTAQISNVGTITAKINGNGTIYAQINPAIGKTQMAVYSVAAGSTFYLTQVTALSGDAAGASKYMNFQAVVTNNLTGVKFTLLHTTWQNIYQVQRVIPLSYGQKQDISWELYTNSGNYSGSIVVEGILITN